MILYPAIDLMGGEAVRLRKGERNSREVFGQGVDFARIYQKEGASWLHLVDLDAAFDGSSFSLPLIEEIVRAFQGNVELGGGIRSLEDMEKRFQLGVQCCILGSAACTHPEIVREGADKYPGRIVVGIDARDGMATVHGWVEKTDISAVDLALRMRDMGIERIIYTDVSKDGMMQGPNFQETERMIRETGMNIVISGGVSCLEDVRRARDIGCSGVILGRALYDGKLTVKTAREALNDGSE